MEADRVETEANNTLNTPNDTNEETAGDTNTPGDTIDQNLGEVPNPEEIQNDNTEHQNDIADGGIISPIVSPIETIINIRKITSPESKINLFIIDEDDFEKDNTDRILENLGASDENRTSKFIVAPRFMYKVSLKTSQETITGPMVPSTSMGMNTKVSSSSRASTKSVDKSTNTSTTEKSSVISVVCRICYDETMDEPVISPCNCKGTIGLVHKTCLERWLAESNTDKCDLCNKQFQTERKTKYTVGTSLCVWLKYRSSQFAFPIRDLKGDIISCSVLSPVALGLIYICLLSADYYNQTEFALVPAAQWTSMSVMLMGLIMLLGFFVWIYLVIRYHSRVWYFWWQRETIVQVYLGENEMIPKHKIPKKHNQINASIQTLDIASNTESTN